MSLGCPVRRRALSLVSRATDTCPHNGHSTGSRGSRRSISPTRSPAARISSRPDAPVRPPARKWRAAACSTRGRSSARSHRGRVAQWARLRVLRGFHVLDAHREWPPYRRHVAHLGHVALQGWRVISAHHPRARIVGFQPIARPYDRPPRIEPRHSAFRGRWRRRARWSRGTGRARSDLGAWHGCQARHGSGAWRGAGAAQPVAAPHAPPCGSAAGADGSVRPPRARARGCAPSCPVAAHAARRSPGVPRP